MLKGTKYPSEIFHSDSLWDSQRSEEFNDSKKLCLECNKNMGSNLCISLYCKSCCIENNKSYAFCPRHHLRRPLKTTNTPKYSTKLKILPPFLEYPEFGMMDPGWRQGGGEGYRWDFEEQFNLLNKSEKKWYMQDFPEPPGWDGFYMDIQQNTTKFEKTMNTIKFSN